MQPEGKDTCRILNKLKKKVKHKTHPTKTDIVMNKINVSMKCHLYKIRTEKISAINDKLKKVRLEGLYLIADYIDDFKDI